MLLANGPPTGKPVCGWPGCHRPFAQTLLTLQGLSIQSVPHAKLPAASTVAPNAPPMDMQHKGLKIGKHARPGNVHLAKELHNNQ